MDTGINNGKIIVTHFSPDVDACASVWLIRRFLPGWEDASVAFVPAGSTFEKAIVDEKPDKVLHVDTGMGMLDHHQLDEDTCAAKRTLEYIANVRNKSSSKTDSHAKFPDEALERLVEVVNDIDHFKEVYMPGIEKDFFDFNLVAILDGLKLLYSEDHHKLMELGLIALDGIYRQLKNKVWAENEMESGGVEFKIPQGKAVAYETLNDETVKLAQKKGFTLVVRKDPNKQYVRIKALPQSTVDLTRAYDKFRKKDPEATWFLHASKRMLLNGSMKNPKTVATKLTLREIVEVLEKNIG